MPRFLLSIAAGLCAALALYGFKADQPAETKVVLLGTGTPRPLPERSGPATAIVVGNQAYLVDFGPGVVRRAAAAAAKGIPALEPTRLNLAFVTHLHSDHTAGYPDLIFTPWVMGRTELNVFGPEGLEEMTHHVLEAWRRDIEIRTTGLEQRKMLAIHAHDVRPGVIFEDEKVKVTAFRVPHGQWPQALGYRFDTPGRSIVISGDTSPSEELIAHCRPCDVLIHETYSRATTKVPVMPDWPLYSSKYHTSTTELADLANRAKPGLLILYHLSGRTPDKQLKAEVEKTYHGKFVIGHDLDVY